MDNKENVQREDVESDLEAIGQYLHDCNSCLGSGARFEAIQSYNKVCRYVNSLCQMQKWISIEDKLPEGRGEYLVAYHPCHWDRVQKEVLVGMDSFRGKSTWAKHKFQRVTHWMLMPKSPKEE